MAGNPDTLCIPILYRMLRDVAGINQVLYGTDFPYLRRDLAVKSKQQILQSAVLNDSERRSILGGNASRLFPCLDSVLRRNGI
jgi:predicted TIM-barrel fold metal-dependent hydrolase